MFETKTRESSSENEYPVVRKLTPGNITIMFCTGAVTFINPCTGRSTLVYAQHDAASQAASERLKNELDLATDKKTDYSDSN